MARRRRVGARTRAQLLRDIPQVLLTDDTLDPAFLAPGLASEAASAALRPFVDRWRGADVIEPVESLKRDITVAAICAANTAAMELQIAPAERKRAKTANELLGDIAARIFELERLFPATFEETPLASAFRKSVCADAPFWAVFDSGARPGDLERLLRSLRDTRQTIGTFQSRWQAPPPGKSRSDPFTRNFISTLARYWRLRSGELPGRSKRGPFVDFLSTAWRAMALHSPVPDDELEDLAGGPSGGRDCRDPPLGRRVGQG
jgi:hypothetical protein